MWDVAQSFSDLVCNTSSVTQFQSYQINATNLVFYTQPYTCSTAFACVYTGVFHPLPVSIESTSCFYVAPAVTH